GGTVFIGRAGLAADPGAEATRPGAGAALNHALQHRGDLIGGDRVDHLGSTILQARRLLAAEATAAVAALASIGAMDGLAVPILSQFDQIGIDPPAAVDEGGI